MRSVEYLSPSSIGVFDKSVDEFYMRYLADERPPRDPQTPAMAVGSSFDAFVKSYYHEKLFGVGNDPKYGFDALFAAQVEPQCRDLALGHGRYVFEQYRQAGC